MKFPITPEEAAVFARDWIAAWNAQDLELILSHYDDAVELTSPVAAQWLQTPEGRVIGKADLRDYFQRGLEAFPQLRFELKTVFRGLRTVVLCYVNQKGTRTAEFMEFSASGKVVRVIANYSV